MILKAMAFVIAWTVTIMVSIGFCAVVVLISPILICGWAMEKTFGPNGW